MTQSVRSRSRRALAESVLLPVLSRFAHVERAPLFVIGNQKSGTSAIASLLARASGRTLTLDIRRAIDDPGVQLRLRFGLETIDEFIDRYRYEFSRQIVKEPALTFFYEQLERRFPQSGFVFVVRRPEANIRSVLNRLQLPGSLDALDLDHLPQLRNSAWRLVLDPAWLGCKTSHYIDGLAARWSLATDVYLRNRSRMVLVRYEDFLEGKRAAIEKLAEQCGLPVVADITSVADRPYQQPGDPCADPDSFFGTRNLERIRSACAPRMAELGYGPRG